MRTLLFFLFAALFTIPAAAQQASPTEKIHVRHLKIESSGLPDHERKEIIRRFKNETYGSAAELSQKIQASLQDLGYFKATVHDPHIAVLKEEPRSRLVDLTVALEAGSKYRIADIRFLHATVFTPEKLRSSFAFSPGDVFSRKSITTGIDKLRQLYASSGYINFTSVPDVTTDETNKTLAITIDIDEGKLFDFGPLVLDGAEPHVGVGRELLSSWESLRGKRYNAFFLEQWFQDNVRNVSPDASLNILPDDESGLVRVKISFPF